MTAPVIPQHIFPEKSVWQDARDRVIICTEIWNGTPVVCDICIIDPNRNVEYKRIEFAQIKKMIDSRMMMRRTLTNQTPKL